jgi:ketosteroid isomerase-like protein
MMSADGNRELIQRFYAAFDACDGGTMAAAYAHDATFQDPVFGTLTGKDVGDMWRMLTDRARDLKVELLEFDADEATGTAHWQARYEFAATGRPVINDVHGWFRFADGLIIEHVDDFSFFAWSRQALGRTGLAVGWSPLGRRIVGRRARAELDRYRAR